MLTVQIRALHPLAKLYLPKCAHPGDAAVDLHADLASNLIIPPGQRVMVETGIAVHIGDPGYVGIVAPRSGLGANHGLILGNTIGVIDSGYTGPLKVSLWNSAQSAYTVHPWARIAQLLIVPVAQIHWQIVERFAKTERGGNGYGSSGE